MNILLVERNNTRVFYWRWIGSSLLILLLAITVASGYYYYRYQQRETYLCQASYTYNHLLHNANHEKVTTEDIPLDKAQAFIQQYKDTPYPALLQLRLAHQAIRQNKLEEAVKWLTRASQEAKDPDIRCIARQRGARVLAAIGQLKEALHFLDDVTDEAYSISTEEIRGDILHALGEKEKALQAYHRAYQTGQDLAKLRPLLQMKINDLSHLSEPATIS